MVKTAITMRDLARKAAIDAGPKILEINDQRRVAYAIDKNELKILYESNGFNTDGIGWLKQICRWRLLGELVPNDATVQSKTSNDWAVCFITLNDAQELMLHSFAGRNELSDAAVIP